MINERISRARRASGMTLRQVGEAVGLSHAAIKKYEDGEVTPSSDVLLKLAKVLGVRTEYFFRQQQVQLQGVEYRKRTLPAKTLRAIEHKVLDMVERRLELEAQFPQSPVHRFEENGALPRVEDLSQIEALAQQVRKAWDLGSDPIPDLVDLLESRGVRVYMLDGNHDEKFDGLAAQVNGQPVIVVGSDWPGDRQRFTLAHELGHLLLHGKLASGVNEEKAANRFSGAFLLPKEALERELGKQRTAVEWRELLLLKAEYGLSMRAISYRLRDLEVVSEDQFVSMQRVFMQRGWNRLEPEPYPKEKAHAFEQLVFHALAEDYISESKAAELMQKSVPDFKRLRAMDGSNAACYQ